MSSKLWQGRTDGTVDFNIDALNRSIEFDQRLYPYDIEGSIAHVLMLGKQGIIPVDEVKQLSHELKSIRDALNQGDLEIQDDVEDIHTWVELELTKRLGSIGKKLHTGRSRNDQVALDMRLYARDAAQEIQRQIEALKVALCAQTEQHEQTMMPGYTHLQRAQPITFGLHLNAYSHMLNRDLARLDDCYKRINLCPLGAGALAGSTYSLDRQWVADELGFDAVLENPLDAVSSRDFVIELLSVISILMTHLSRLAEELILWNSQEFGFIQLSDAHTTGSSMMPQKKNPDVAELVRGKTGRVFGNLMGMLTVMKALPLAYNKDMQEDKEALFDAVDTLKLCLPALTATIQGMQAKPIVMRKAAETGFLNATDLADYLVRQGVPFRDAYALVGQAVQYGVEHGCTLESIPLTIYQQFSSHFKVDLYEQITLEQCIQARLR